jgi:uncharacterized cupin superfamily protein
VSAVLEKPIVNLADVPLTDSGDGDRFVAKLGRVGPLIGSTAVGCRLHVVPAGKRAFPFHRHHVIHELFIILSGSAEYRHGDKTDPIRAGDVIAAPAGGEAHQIVNSGTDELRYLAISTKQDVDVVDYPDSDQFGVVAGIKNNDLNTATFKYMGRFAAVDPAECWK